MKRIHKVIAICGSAALLTLTLTPAALAAGSVSASHGKGGTRTAGTSYSGKTSQSEPIKFTFKSGEVSGTIEWKAKCTGGATLTSGTNFKAKVKNGKFAVSGKYTAPINKGQYEGHYSVSIAGSGVGSKTAKGTFKGSAGLFSGSSKIATCKSGSVTWSAKKK